MKRELERPLMEYYILLDGVVGGGRRQDYKLGSNCCMIASSNNQSAAGVTFQSLRVETWRRLWGLDLAPESATSNGLSGQNLHTKTVYQHKVGCVAAKARKTLANARHQLYLYSPCRFALIHSRVMIRWEWARRSTSQFAIRLSLPLT